MKSLESVQELERVLLEELDNQQEIEGRVQNIWTGNKALEAKEMIYYSLTEGNHDKAKKYTQGMSRGVSEPVRHRGPDQYTNLLRNLNQVILNQENF